MDYLMNFTGSITTAIDYLNTAVSLPFELVTLLPPFFGGVIVSVVAVMVVKLVLGR